MYFKLCISGTNSDDRNPRRRRTRSRSPTTRSSPPAPRNRFANQSNRRPKSRSKSPGADKDKPKPRSTSSNQSGAPKAPPAEEPQAEKIVKTIKNNHVSPEHMERLEKRRRKFEGESEMVAPTKKVIKIMAAKKEKQLPTTGQSAKQGGSSEKSPVAKGKVPKSKRSVELVNESDLNPTPAKHNEKVGNQNRHNNEDSKEKSSGGDNQEDLRARLIKKKMEKQLQEGSSRKTGGSGSSSSSNGHLSSVVVPVGSQRIFSQALKNSQLLDMSSEASSSSKGSSKLNRNKPSLNSSTAETPTKSHKPKSVVASSRSSEGSSKKISSSRGGTGSSASTSSNRSKSSGTKRVVSVTYS